MKIKHLVISLLTFLTLLSNNIFSQQFTQFSGAHDEYLREMQSLFDRSEMYAKQGTELLDGFEDLWLDNRFSFDERTKIIEISNMMLKKKARNFPHFFNYIRTLKTIREKSVETRDYKAWEEGLINLLNQKKTRLDLIDTYITSAYFLVSENIIHQSNTVNWYTDNPNYDIVFENDTAKITFQSLTLKCKLRNDSIQIFNTSGTYYPYEGIWRGNKATITWEHLDIDRNATYAEVDSYTIDMSKSFYEIPNARLYHLVYFDYPIVGTLTDKVVEVRNKTLASYPRFESDEKRFELKNFAPDIDYIGGFSMKGAKFLGKGSMEQKAMLNMWRNVEYVTDYGDTLIRKELFMQTRSLTYALTETNITSNNAEVSMYIDTDSIYHPGLLFKYYNKNREINLIREESAENKSRSPYYNTYHQIEMDFEYLTWNMDQEEVNLTMLKGTAINVAKFESTNYFSARRFYELQGLETSHPFSMLHRYAEKYDTDFVHAHDFAKFWRLPLPPIHNLFIELSYQGFLEYNTENQIAFIKPKMYKYLKSRVGLIDYDLIKFESRTNAPKSNAVLNLKNMDLEIQGVPEINLSDSQNVIFYPKNQELLFKKNRNFDFSGRIEAGLFTFYGDNFQFKYDSFLVDLNKIDSLSIKVQSGVDGWGRRQLSNVQNVIENVTGNLQIDNPDNKSGVQHFPQYPIFESKKSSYVYYDDYSIQYGKYPRDSFYFEVYPYTIDSLNTFTTLGMGYDGKFKSAAIFPVFEQRLVLQKDYSLGFSHPTPEEGFPAYGGKGQYYEKINLSNQGLRGDGKLEYLSSISSSNDFIFYPDSMNGFTNSYEIAGRNQGVQYPDVKAGNIYIHWMPYQDNMQTKSTGEPFVMYNGKSKHYGTLDYTPASLIGSGLMNYYNSDLTSKYITYNYSSAAASTSNFKVYAEESDTIAFAANNVSALVDFDEMKSTFQSNSGITRVELPKNLYAAYIEEFSWMMLEKKMQFATNTTSMYEPLLRTGVVSEIDAQEAPIGSLFISTHSAQDSLNWISPLADFDLNTNIINAHKVTHIDIADARIFPNNGDVTVNVAAKLQSLKNAKLFANRELRYHNFHSATVNIFTRTKYFGEGTYDYHDENGKIQPIDFHMIAVDTLGSGNSFAKGKIPGIQDFTLSPAFAYQGNVDMYAPEKFLKFTGAAKISHECDYAIDESWVKFSETINPEDIYIPISAQPMDINESFLVSGPMIATDSVHMFPAFLTQRKRYSNRSVSTAEGYMMYDKKVKTYKIAQKYRLQNNDTTGNIISLNSEYCNIFGEGDIDLTAELGRIKIKTTGTSNYKLEENEESVQVLMTLDFYLPDASFKYIADTINSKGSSLPNLNLRSISLDRSLKQMVKNYSVERLQAQLEIFGEAKELPKELTTSFVFTDLRLKWNHDMRAWQSSGPLSISIIKGQQVNKVLKGHIEIIKKRSGDIFNLYIEVNPGHWYYFNYRRGLMQTYSSEKPYNKIISEIKSSDRKLKPIPGEAPYIFFLSNARNKDKFLQHIESGDEFEDNEDDDKKLRKGKDLSETDDGDTDNEESEGDAIKEENETETE